MTNFYKMLTVRAIKEPNHGVISNPGIPGEKSRNLKQISTSRGLGIQMTVASFVITSLCLIKLGKNSK
jgi:hypothetical protein